MRNLHRTEKVIYFIVLFHVLLGMALAWFNLAYFETHYVSEEGIIEWMTFDSLLLIGVLSFYRFNLFKKKKWPFLIVLFITGLFFLICAGEEISWGQRLIGLKSPQYFLTHNSDGATNFHDCLLKHLLGEKRPFRVDDYILWPVIGSVAVFYLLLAPFLYRHSKKIRQFANGLAIPVPKPLHVVAFIILVILSLLIPSAQKMEILKFASGWVLFLLVLYPQNEDNFR
ncbi:MAG: hypothetical protein WCG27_07825 [Pseudomonadota bacterium]